MNIEFALKLRFYRSLKSLICLKWIRKKFSTTLQTQFNYFTLPVTPFNRLLESRIRVCGKFPIKSCTLSTLDWSKLSDFFLLTNRNNLLANCFRLNKTLLFTSRGKKIKELSFCTNSDFPIFSTQCWWPMIFQTMNSVRSNNISFKSPRFKPSGCRDIGIRTFKFVVKTQFLYYWIFYRQIFSDFMGHKELISLHWVLYKFKRF